jgi:hypothetical protein
LLECSLPTVTTDTTSSRTTTAVEAAYTFTIVFTIT